MFVLAPRPGWCLLRWGRRPAGCVTPEGLAANDATGNDHLEHRRLELQLGYDLPAFGDRLALTPEVGLGLYESGRDYRIGWNLTQPDDGESFSSSFDATRRENANNNDNAPEHGVQLELNTRFRSGSSARTAGRIIRHPLHCGNHVGKPLSHALTMTSSTPTSKPQQQTPATAAPVEPKPQKPWWRPWLEPILVVTIVIALFTTLVSGGVVMFQSLKGDIVASETRVSERIDRVGARIDRLAVSIGTVEASLREEIRASEARQNQQIVELKEEIRASEARQSEQIVELKEEIRASEARQSEQIVELKEEIQASEARQNKRIDELRQDNAELRAEFKADMRAMDNKLDRVLEALPASPTPVQN